MIKISPRTQIINIPQRLKLPLCSYGIIDLNSPKAQITKMSSKPKLPNCSPGTNYQNTLKASITPQKYTV